MNEGLASIYTNLRGPNEEPRLTVKDELMRGRTADEQLFIEYRVLNKTRYAATKTISCNFIAGQQPSGSVQLMVTSASFDSPGFDQSSSLHTVIVTTVSTKEFETNFLNKLATV